MKTCTKCHIEKDESEFYKDCKAKDGLGSYCRNCRLNNNKVYYLENKERAISSCKRYAKANRKKINERKRKWRIKTGSDKKYYDKNRGKVISRVSDYRSMDRERWKRYLRDYYKTNSENLTDVYIKRYFKKYKIETNNELLEIKRFIIKIKRHVKEKKKSNKQPTGTALQTR